MRKLLIFLRRERLWTGLCLLFMIMSAILTILQAGFIANIISFTVNLDQAQQTLPSPDTHLGLGEKVMTVIRLLWEEDNLSVTRYILSQQDYLFYGVLALISIFFISLTQSFFFLRDFSNQYFTYRLSSRIREEFYSKALGYDYLYLRDRHKGDIISRVISDIKMVEADIYPFLESLIYGPMILSFGLTSMFVINARFTLILILTFLVLGIGIFLVSSFFKKLVRLTQEKLSDITVHIKNSLDNIDVIKVFNRKDFETQRFSAMISQHLHLLKRSILIQFLNRPISELFITIGGLLIIFYSSGMIIDDQITITHLFSFFTILIYVVPYVQRINNGFFLKQKISVAMTRLFGIDQETYAEKKDGEDLDAVLAGKGMPPFQGNIEFRNVGFHYLPDRAALEGVSFTAAHGKFIAIVGMSGSGKTTLLNMLPLLIRPDSGKILYDGVPHRHLSLDGVRKHISYVPQESALFPVSIRENILYGNLQASEEMIQEAARLANIHDVIVGLPDGYDTLVGDQGSKLSVGQKQRLAIARALIKNPRVLILDEATSALDSISENLIQESLKKISQEKTIIAIAHRLSTVLEADAIVVMENGRIRGVGTHQELLQDNSVYQNLYHKQFQELN